ncbi:MAG: hypothetical protein ACR2OG_13280 [Gemmatimonadaceae bacterium]
MGESANPTIAHEAPTMVGSMAKGALIGAVIGGVASGGVTYLVADDSCDLFYQCSRGQKAKLSFVLGAAAGAVIGAIVGLIRADLQP